jgi:ribosomal protein S12 methylthiotransferase accessory factor
LEGLGYRAANPACEADDDIDAATLHRVRLLEAAAQFERIFELGAPEAPGLACFGAEVDPALIHPMHQGSPLLAVSGVGLSLQEAFQKCVGEGVEYLSQLQSGEDVLVPSAARPAVLDEPMQDFVAALDLRPGAKLSWFAARRLTNAREVMLPADICLRRPEARRDFTAPFPLSIGSAAGTSWDAAALHALLELIERDAASLWWRGGRRGSAVSPSVDVERLTAKLRPPGVARRRTWFLDITTDVGVPSVVATSCRTDGFGVAFGLASRPTLTAALRSAMLEMCQLELAYAVIEAKRAQRGEAGLNAKDHVHLERATAINADHCLLLQPVSGSVEHIELETTSPRSTREAIAQRLQSLGIEAYCLDLTRSRFKIPVARVIAPALQLEPSDFATPRLAETIARTGGGAAYTGGVSLL